MSSIESGFAQTARGRIYYEVSGPKDAPALVFFGMSTSQGGLERLSRGYREQLDQTYRFLVCDYPVGVGGSERREDAPPMTPSQVAEDYLAIADAAGFDRFACVGYSYGANTSLQLAARHPERLTALVAGGWPALGGDFKAVLAACKSLQASAAATSRAMAAVNDDFITYYEALQDWDDRPTARSLTMPRLNFADARDRAYPGRNIEIDVGPAFVRNESELRAMGWETRTIETNAAPDEVHIAALQPEIVVPLLREFLGRVL